MTKREPNPRGDGEQLRAQLVAAASALLLSPQSIALPSLRAVARACSVSPAAVYLHFDSQHALVAAVVDTQVAELRDVIRRALHDAEPEAQPFAFALAYVTWGIEHPGAYQLLFESADQLQIDHDEHDEGWNLILDAGVIISTLTGASADDAQTLALRLWAGIHGLVSLRLHKPGIAWPTSVREEITQILGQIRVTRQADDAPHYLPTANRAV